MDSLRGKYRVLHQELDVCVETNSAVLQQSFVAESLQRDARKDNRLNAFRGLVNAMIISLAFWSLLGITIFMFS